MPELHTRPLDADSWPFAELVEANNGVWGACWCMGFHPEGFGDSAEANRIAKHERVCAGTAQAALVFEDDRCLGWCQYGLPDHLTRIKSKKPYDAGADPNDPADWRITCFYVGKGLRKRGVAGAALAGALDQIAAAGGGVVESYPEDITGATTSAAFLHNGTLALFERHGVEPMRKIVKRRWVVRRTVDPT